MALIENFIIKVQTVGEQALDSLKRKLNDTGKEFDKTQSKSDKLGTALGGLGKRVTGMAGGLGAAEDAVGALGSRLGLLGGGVVAVAGAFVALGLKAINIADQIQDISDATGISAGQLLNFKQSLLEAGGKADDFEKFATKLSQTLGDAANGNEKVRKTFRDLGVDLGDANGNLRDTGDILPDVLDALAKIENPAQRAATAVEILGKSAKNIDWTNVRAGKDAITDEQIKQLAAYRGEMDKLANTIETKLITAFGELAKIVNKGGVEAGFAKVTEEIGKLVGYILNLPTDAIAAAWNAILPDSLRINKAVGVGDAVIALAKKAEQARLDATIGGGRGGQGGPTAKELADYNASKTPGKTPGKTGQLAISDAGKKSIATAQAITDALRQQGIYAEQYNAEILKSVGLQTTEGQIVANNAAIERERLNKVADLNKQIKTAQADKERDPRVVGAEVAELQKQIGLVNQQASAQKTADESRIRLLEQQRQKQADINLLTQQISEVIGLSAASKQNELIGLFGEELQLKQGLLNIENERIVKVAQAEAKILQLGKDATQADKDRRDNEVKFAQDAANAKIAILKDQIAREKALQQDAEAGYKQSLENIASSFTPFNMAQKRTEILWGNIENALDKFVDTGKLNFGDFTRSIIADLLKMELKASASSLLKAAGGFSGIASSAGSFFSSLFGYADGGNPPVNRPSIVGERGPELFVPKTAGTIVPNGGMMGGSVTNNTYVTNNISAVDAKSVAQLFAENRKTLLGVTEQARKELPIRQRV